MYQKFRKFGITLAEGLQAFFVLNTANVAEENEKLSKNAMRNFNV